LLSVKTINFQSEKQTPARIVQAKFLDVVVVTIWDQREFARDLDCRRQLTLIFSLGTGDTTRNDFAVLGQVLAQGVQIFVIDVRNAFGSEFAELTAAEKFRHVWLLA
jgi:hypothetical protein